MKWIASAPFLTTFLTRNSFIKPKSQGCPPPSGNRTVSSKITLNPLIFSESFRRNSDSSQETTFEVNWKLKKWDFIIPVGFRKI